MSGRPCDLALMCVRKRREAHMCAPRHIAEARDGVGERRSCRVARSECSQGMRAPHTARARRAPCTARLPSRPRPCACPWRHLRRLHHHRQRRRRAARTRRIQSASAAPAAAIASDPAPHTTTGGGCAPSDTAVAAPRSHPNATPPAAPRRCAAGQAAPPPSPATPGRRQRRRPAQRGGERAGWQRTRPRARARGRGGGGGGGGGGTLARSAPCGATGDAPVGRDGCGRGRVICRSDRRGAISTSARCSGARTTSRAWQAARARSAGGALPYLEPSAASPRAYPNMPFPVVLSVRRRTSRGRVAAQPPRAAALAPAGRDAHARRRRSATRGRPSRG